jgi:hypothetical protein
VSIVPDPTATPAKPSRRPKQEGITTTTTATPAPDLSSTSTPALTAASKPQPDIGEDPKPTEPTEHTKSDNTVNEQPSPPASSNLEEENTLLRSRVAELQRDLHEAQDFLFSLQPRLQTLTEAEAVEEYQGLCAAIENWVDQKLADSLEEMTVDPELRLKDIQNLMDFIPGLGKAAFNHRGTDVDNIQAVILRFLTEAIFSQDFYCPLARHEREFVTAVERSMRTLQPRRGMLFALLFHAEHN